MTTKLNMVILVSKIFCSFRISCDDLEVEMGTAGYCSPFIAPADRIGKICNIQTETEEHFVILS